MRDAARSGALAVGLGLLAGGFAWAQTASQTIPQPDAGAGVTAPHVIGASPRQPAEAGPAPVPQPVPVAPPARIARAAGGPCANPDALGVAREVEIDPAGGPRYGFQQYKTNDFLSEGEIVLTFDDGPMPAYTNPILKALDHHCTKATFFIVGRMALAHPETVRDEAARGHTIANHTWSHANLGPRRIVPKRTPGDGRADLPGDLLAWPPADGRATLPPPQSGPFFTGSVAPRPVDPFGFQLPGPPPPPQPTFLPPMAPEKAKAEIELGFSATARALGVPMAPFFRFPYLGQSTAMLNYLGTRNVAVFSIDVDSVDYRAKSAQDVSRRVLTDLGEHRKGILLFHDIQAATAQALPGLLDELKKRGFRVVHLKPKSTLQTIASFDAQAEKESQKRIASTDAKPLIKRTATWGMQGDASALGVEPGDAGRRAKRPLARGDSPGYVPPGPGQPEILPWLVGPRRAY